MYRGLWMCIDGRLRLWGMGMHAGGHRGSESDITNMWRINCVLAWKESPIGRRTAIVNSKQKDSDFQCPFFGIIKNNKRTKMAEAHMRSDLVN